MKYRASTWTAAALLGASLAVPTAARAQDSTAAGDARGHVVRRGDTLWGLARTYLNDPFLWPEIYRLNTGVVEDPHWIYPNERLRLPGDAGVTVADGASSVEVGATVFASNRSDANHSAGATDRLQPLGGPASSVVRAGEIIPAPFIDGERGPAGAGRILRPAGLTRIATTSDREEIQPDDDVYLVAPANAAPAPGDRYVAFSLGPSIEKVGRVIVPAGILQVTRVSAGEATTARVVRVFDRMASGQGVMALDSSGAPAGVRPAPVTGGAEGTVVYVHAGAVLPTLQSYLVMDIGSGRGVRPGDQVTIFSPRERRPGEPMTPERRIGAAQIVRVTRSSATAIIVDQSEPAIRTGARVRVTAKMP